MPKVEFHCFKYNIYEFIINNFIINFLKCFIGYVQAIFVILKYLLFLYHSDYFS